MSEFFQPNTGLIPHNAACMRRGSSFTNEVVPTICGTLLDSSDLMSVEDPNESMETRYKEINWLIGEILWLVDLLFADHGVTATLPGEAV